MSIRGAGELKLSGADFLVKITSTAESFQLKLLRPPCITVRGEKLRAYTVEIFSPPHQAQVLFSYRLLFCFVFTAMAWVLIKYIKYLGNSWSVFPRALARLLNRYRMTSIDKKHC